MCWLQISIFICILEKFIEFGRFVFFVFTISIHHLIGIRIKVQVAKYLSNTWFIFKCLVKIYWKKKRKGKNILYAIYLSLFPFQSCKFIMKNINFWFQYQCWNVHRAGPNEEEKKERFKASLLKKKREEEGSSTVAADVVESIKSTSSQRLNEFSWTNSIPRALIPFSQTTGSSYNDRPTGTVAPMQNISSIIPGHLPHFHVC